MNYHKYLLLDSPGLGKSLQSIAVALARKEQGVKHCLVIVGVNGLKFNWQEEIKKHAGMESIILGARKNKKGRFVVKGNEDKLEDLSFLSEYFIITNVESLRYKPIVDRLKAMCSTGDIGLIIFDEIHKCKSNTSAQCKGLLKLNPEYKIGMTGTILMNSPEDLFVPLNWIGKETSIFTTFKARYCVFGNFGAVVNYMHLDELQAKLESVSLRRTKEEVLDLPPKIYMTEYVELGQKQQKVYNDIVKEIIDNIDKVKLSPNPLTMLIRLRQATSFTSILSSSVDESVKLERLQELIEEAINNDGKVVIYSNWTTVTDILQEKLIKYNPAIITGKTKDRMGQKDKFMTDDTCKICIGTIGALGTGFTLTVANTAIFLDEPYTFAEYEQASDRIYRIGTTKSVNIISLLAKNTIDERVHSIVQRKKKLSDGIVDNAYDLSKPDIVDFLLS